MSEKKPASDGKAIEVKKPANVDETKQEDNDQLMEQLIKLRFVFLEDSSKLVP